MLAGAAVGMEILAALQLGLVGQVAAEMEQIILILVVLEQQTQAAGVEADIPAAQAALAS
jgi:hypothetical protein